MEQIDRLEEFGLLERFRGLVSYNRDWFRYLSDRAFGSGGGDLRTYRLRNGQVVQVRPDARFILNEIYLHRVYDIPGVDISRCRHVLDLGANVGVFALYVAAHAPNAEIVCLEPSGANFSVLEDNIRANAVAAGLYKYAIASEEGYADLSLAGNSCEYSIGNGGPNSEKVRCVNFDTVLGLSTAGRFDLVKMDVEGAEKEILANMSDDHLSRIGALCIEWHYSMEELRKVVTRLKEAGFHAFPEVRASGASYIKAIRSV